LRAAKLCKFLASIRNQAGEGAFLGPRPPEESPIGVTLKEEFGADTKLTKIAESRLNKEAAE